MLSVFLPLLLSLATTLMSSLMEGGSLDNGLGCTSLEALVEESPCAAQDVIILLLHLLFQIEA